MELAVKKLDALMTRAQQGMVPGQRRFNPGWHLAGPAEHVVGVAVHGQGSAGAYRESREGRTRDDYPTMAPIWRHDLLICTLEGDHWPGVTGQRQLRMRADLLALFESDELRKYYPEAELTGTGLSDTSSPDELSGESSS